MPDGINLITYVDKNTNPGVYLQSINKTNKTITGAPKEAYIVSPNGRMICGLESTPQGEALLVYNFITQRTATLFTAPQTTEEYGNTNNVSMIGDPMWLSGSQAILVNVKYGNLQNNNDIWLLKTSGEPEIAIKNVELIANSANGIHWLVKKGNSFYLLDIIDE